MPWSTTINLQKLGHLGPDHLAWLQGDLKRVSSEPPLEVFSHIPLFAMYPDWGWGTDDATTARGFMRRFGFGHCPQRPRAPAHEDGRGQCHLPHRGADGLPAAPRRRRTDNVLVDGTTARLVDWAWPTKGAAFIDAACLIVRLIFAGHPPAHAEAMVADLPAWKTAPRRAVDLLAAALCRMWTEIADADPTAWKTQAMAAARTWHTHRNH